MLWDETIKGTVDPKHFFVGMLRQLSPYSDATTRWSTLIQSDPFLKVFHKVHSNVVKFTKLFTSRNLRSGKCTSDQRGQQWLSPHFSAKLAQRIYSEICSAANITDCKNLTNDASGVVLLRWTLNNVMQQNQWLVVILHIFKKGI